MVELVTGPPPPEALARMTAIEGVRLTPAMLATQEGPAAGVGPEAAGALLILQTTFVDAQRAEQFWLTAAGLMEVLASAPGFIRRISFADGPLYLLLAFWRAVADAHAFYAHPQHQAAMKALYRDRWQYTHFAGLWEMTTPRQRVIFCQECDGITPVGEGECHCSGCGTALLDPYRSTVPLAASS